MSSKPNARYISLRAAPASLRQMQGYQKHVDGLDADEGNNNAAYAVDQQIVAQQDIGGLGLVLDALECQRNQRHDDDGVEDDRRKNSRVRGGKVHDIERLERRKDGHEHGWNDGKVLGHVVGDGEGGQSAAGHQELLADLHDFDELG